MFIGLNDAGGSEDDSSKWEIRVKKDELVDLHIFVDRSIVEVFVNGRPFVAERAYHSLAESVGVSIRAQGQLALLKSLSTWQMKDIFD